MIVQVHCEAKFSTTLDDCVQVLEDDAAQKFEAHCSNVIRSLVKCSYVVKDSNAKIHYSDEMAQWVLKCHLKWIEERHIPDNIEGQDPETDKILNRQKTLAFLQSQPIT